MPFVATTDALNARCTRIDLDAPLTARSFDRLSLIGSPSLRLVLIAFLPHSRTVAHRHPRAAEFFLVIGGSGTFTIGDDGSIVVARGDLLLAQANETHVIEAGDGGLRIMAGVYPNEDRPDETIDLAPEDVGRS